MIRACQLYFDKILCCHLSVPVDNVIAMEVRESRDDLCRVEPHAGQAEPPGRPEVVEELPPSHVGEQQVEVPAIYTGPEELYQEGMFDGLKQWMVGNSS